MLNIRHLETLLAVLATGSFHAAARRLGCSQPTVTQHIRKLEAALGARLIKRGARGCVPTPEAELLQPYAASLVRLSTRAVDAVGGRTLTLGAGSNIGIYVLQPLLKAYAQEPGAAAVELRIDTNPRIADGLSDGTVDLALLEWWDDRPGFAAMRWRQERLVVIVDPGHPWAGRRWISPDMLRGQTLIGGEPGSGTGRVLRTALAEIAPTLTVDLQLGSTDAVKHAVKAGRGISIVLEAAIHDELRAGSLCALRVRGAELAKRLYAVRRADLPVESPTARFCAWLLSAARRPAGYLYGSAASRRPSPRKLKASTATITGATGASSQG